MTLRKEDGEWKVTYARRWQQRNDHQNSTVDRIADIPDGRVCRSTSPHADSSRTPRAPSALPSSCTALTRGVASVIWLAFLRVVFNARLAPRPAHGHAREVACANQPRRISTWHARRRPRQLPDRRRSRSGVLTHGQAHGMHAEALQVARMVRSAAQLDQGQRDTSVGRESALIARGERLRRMQIDVQRGSQHEQHSH